MPSLRIGLATPDDATAIAALRSAAADALTREFGSGHWSGNGSERGAMRDIATARVLVARERGRIVGTLVLATRKPWAIDLAHFTPVRRALYLLNMVVLPSRQRRGVGRACLAAAERLARELPAEAIRLDAYDSIAGAGGFYARCGYRHCGRVVYRGVPLAYFEKLVGPGASRVRVARPLARASHSH